jgi:hypothetical protein
MKHIYLIILQKTKEIENKMKKNKLYIIINTKDF